MKVLLSFAVSLLLTVNCFAASPSFGSFYTNHFTTNGLLIRAKLNPTQFDTNASAITITITNIAGIAGQIWTNSLGVIRVAPEITYDYVAPSNTLLKGWYSTSPQIALLSLGTNVIDTTTQASHLLFSQTNDAAQVTLSLTDGPTTDGPAGAFLEIMSYTNTVWDGRFTLPHGSTVSGGGFVRLNNGQDWIGANGNVLQLKWIAPDWWEIGRWSAGTNSQPGLVVINPTDTYLPYRIDEDEFGDSPLFRTGASSLGLGTNLAAFWTPGIDDIFAGVHDVAAGESDYSYFYIGNVDDGGSSTNYADLTIALETFGLSPSADINLVANATNDTSRFHVFLQPDQAVANIELINQGTTTFSVADTSGYTGTGVNALTDDGTYKTLATVNPTDLYIPYRTSATAFGDSPLVRTQPYAVTLLSEVNNNANFILKTEDVNTVSSFITMNQSDSDGPTDTVWMNGGKTGSGWGMGTPNLRDGYFSINVLHDTSMSQRFNIDGDTGLIQFSDRDGTPNFSVANVSGYTGDGSKTLTDDGTYKDLGAVPIIYTNIFSTNLTASTDHDIYTIPTGYRGVPYFSVSTTNTSGTTTTSFKVKISGTYYVLTSGANATTNIANLVSTTFVFEPGDTVAVQGSLDGLNAMVGMALIRDSSPLKSARLTTFIVGDNTLYTVPANKVAVGADRSALLSAAAVGPTALIHQASGGPLQYLAYYNVTKIADKALTSGGAPTALAAVSVMQTGDDFIINSASTDATQFAWITVYEVDQ